MSDAPDYPPYCCSCNGETFDLVTVDGEYAWECRDCEAWTFETAL